MANIYKELTKEFVLEMQFEVIPIWLNSPDSFDREITKHRMKIMSQKFLEKHKDQLFDMFNNLSDNKKE